MTALARATVALFDQSGAATPVLRELMVSRGELPRGPLVDGQGRAQPAFRQFLKGIVTKPLPVYAAALADDQGRPTRVFSMLLANLP